MEKFDINVRRTSHQFATISIEAGSLEQAREKALDEAGNYEYSEKDAEYFIVDVWSKEQSHKLKLLAASPFVSGDNPVEQYEKLLKASERGHGNDAAINHAQVFQPLETYSVDDVIELIELHTRQIESVL